MPVFLNSFFIFVFFALLASFAHANETWRFLPCFGKDIRGIESHITADGHFYSEMPLQVTRLLTGDFGLQESHRPLVAWHRVEFPHREFMELMPTRRVFGWYGCEFNLPSELMGMDILVDLGIIDDSDETFVNGVKVGGMGRIPDGSAWQSDRLYRVQANLLKPSRNFMAVHVSSIWGLGGIVGPPVLKAAFMPADAHCEVAFAAEGIKEIDYMNNAISSEKALSMVIGDRPKWQNYAMPWRGYASWKERCHYAVFKITFDLKENEWTSRLISSPVVVDMGPIFDVAAFYLNGKRISLLGRFPEVNAPAFTETAERGRFVVKPCQWKADGSNEIIAVLYRERGVGGLPNIPGVLLANPLDALDYNRNSITSAFGVLLQTGRREDAKKLLEQMRCLSVADNSWRLSHLAHLAYLEWLDGGRRDKAPLEQVLAAMAGLFGKLPNESPRQSAMQAFCHILRLAEKDEKVMTIVRKYFPSFDKTCRLLPPDRTTQGDWPLFYGNIQTILPAYGKLSEFVHPHGGKNLYMVETSDSNDMPRRWQPRAAAFVAVTHAHIMPASQYPGEWESTKWLEEYWRTGRLFPGVRIRRASWWDDHGEMHPFDDSGPDLTTSLGRVLERGQMLSLHVSDFDWCRTLHPRQQSIIITDTSGRLLNACWSGKSDMGVYERFVFAEDTKVRFKVMKHRSACVALSGVFIDAPGVVMGNGQAVSTTHPVAMMAKEALSLVAEAEQMHSMPSVIAEYRARLSKMKEFNDVVWLAQHLAVSRGIHNVWLALAAGRLMELKGENPDERRRKAMRTVAELCDFNARVPFKGIFLHIADE